MDPKTSCGPTKRLIVACDGTWLNSDNGYVRDSYIPPSGHLAVPSNVTRICRALLPETPEGIQQIIYYQAGVGTSGSTASMIWGGATGEGLSENIREAYGFLASNYDRGDEIFLLGFSRGAFTARSICAMINSVGLLTMHGMEDFYPIFKDWENQDNKKHVTAWPDRPFPDRPNIRELAYARQLESLGLSRLRIIVKVIGVWDTVGALGIPSIGPFPPRHREYSFVNNRVAANVEYGFQALALDEYRKAFKPTLWEQPDGPSALKLLRQCWFPGVHSNVGGSYPDASLADISLTWMVSHLTPFLSFSPAYLPHQYNLTASLNEPSRPYPLGRIYNSSTGFTALTGSSYRTPGMYYAPVSSRKREKRMLEGTNEVVHPSVRIRIEMGGAGTADKGLYKPRALKGWRVVGYPGKYRWVGGEGKGNRVSNQEAQGKRVDGVREGEEEGQSRADGKMMLPEERLGELEMELLRRTPEALKCYIKDGGV